MQHMVPLKKLTLTIAQQGIQFSVLLSIDICVTDKKHDQIEWNEINKSIALNIEKYRWAIIKKL